MSPRIVTWIGLIGITATIPLVQTVAVAKSSVEVQRIAKQVTVQISGCGYGSGVIIRKNSSTYTVLTVAHAVKTSGCEVTTPDDTKYRIAGVKTFPNSVDLAVFTFTSSKNYSVAQLTANSDAVEAGETVYVSGFPLSSTINNSIFAFIKGDVVSNSNTKQQGKGYSLIYSNNTLPGQSGGPVWNDKGEVIAIHGRGDVDTQSQQTSNDSVRVKTGYNLGITVNTFAKLARATGIGGYTPVTVAAKPKPVDDLFASAVLKDRKGDYRGMVADLNQALALDARNARLYYALGVAKAKLNDNAGALADYDRALAINPNYTAAYINRGLLNKNQLNDIKGALADYNRALAINPNYALAYINRGTLRQEKLNDIKGVLADYERASAINPNYAAAYYNHGNLKKNQLNGIKSALADYNRALAINPNFAEAYSGRGNLRQDQLNDINGALTDYNRALAINPNSAVAYYNRGRLNKNQLNDIKGALADYNRALAINPNFAEAYYGRGSLKALTLNDRSGAIIDMQQAAKLFQQKGDTRQYQASIDLLKALQNNSGK